MIYGCKISFILVILLAFFVRVPDSSSKEFTGKGDLNPPAIDLAPQLRKADEISAMIILTKGPQTINRMVDLDQYLTDFSREDCGPAHARTLGLEKTFSYLDKIWDRLIAGSHLQRRSTKKSGICFVLNFTEDPYFINGVITLPVQILLSAKWESEMAFILAHELSHFFLKHQLHTAFINSELMIESFTERWQWQTDAERDADEMALKMLLNARYPLHRGLRFAGTLRLGASARYYSTRQLQSLSVIVEEDYRKEGTTPFSPASIKPSTLTDRKIPSEIVGEAKRAFRAFFEEDFTWRDRRRGRQQGILKGLD
jgi:hypothetical protein